MISAAEIYEFKGAPLRKACTFLLLFFASLGNILGQDPANEVPVYNHFSKVDLVNLSISLSGVNTEDIPISIDVGPQNNVYVLTLGDGIEKRNSNGGIIKSNFITGLNSPLDLAIDNNGFIYVADYSEDGSCFENGKIKIFNPDGSFNRQFYTGFYRPLGLDVDSDGNVYVAEYNQPENGCENEEFSRVSIYNLSGTRIDSESSVSRPYRIAVSSDKTVYLSQEGNGDPAVLILDQNLNITGSLPNIESPGSVVVDSFDFIHVVEYAGRIDFSRFINFENLSFSEIQDIAEEIDKGIDDNAFFIKVFSPNVNYEFQYQEELDFPVDIAFNECDRMYVNDGFVDGSNTFFGYVPQRIEFDLDIFQRTPAFDITDPVITCPADIVVEAETGNDYAVVNYTNATATDVCGVTLNRTSGLASGSQFQVGENTVEFTATDSFGNFSTCSLKITVNPAEDTDEPPSFTNCPSNITADNDSGQCGAIVTFGTPTASDEDGDVEVIQTGGPASGEMFPVGTTTVTFSATDEEDNTTECSFNVTVIDDQDPSISCPANIEETVAFGEDGKIVTYAASTFDDNCPGASIVQTAGLASGSEFPLGNTVNTFVVTDASGRTNTCSFTVRIKEAEDTEDPVINCPNPITRNTDNGVCGAIVSFSAEATDNSGSVTVERTDTGPASGEIFSVGIHTLTYKATDEAGNSSTCSFDITVTDDEAPQVICISSYSITIAEEETRTISADDLDNGSTDNCGITNLSISKDTFTAEDEGEVPVTLTVRDAAGLTASCEVNIEVNVTRENTLTLSCPGDYEVFADENCQYFVPDFSEIVEVSPEGATIEQSLEAGSTTITNADPFVTITATFDGQTETCDVYLLLKDEIPPEVNCPPGETITLAEGESFSLPDYRDQLEISENCEIVDIIQDPLPGTEINQDTQVSFLITDEAGNTADCSFELSVIAEGSLAISCPADKIENLNENCSFTVPDYTTGAQVSNGGDAEISQTPEAGTVITGSGFEVALRVEKEDEFDECTFFVSLKDNIAPVANCVANYQIQLNEGDTVTLEPSDIDSGSSDNCGDIGLSLSQTEFSSANEGENTVTLTVTDAAGNSSSCEAVVQVTVTTGSVNDPPVAIDEEYTTEINTSLDVPASNGVLVNDSDPENDELTAILDTNVSHGDLELNADGSFVYKPATGFVGQDYFTYFANDGEFNSNVIFVSINVVNSSGDFGCNSQVFLSLGPEGEARLDMELLYYGNSEGIEVSADQLVFTCNDIGENLVSLTYTGRLVGSCEVPVTVVDDTPPVLQLRDISIDLDLQGNANITFDDIDNGSFDQCSVEYTLSKTSFTCKNLGDNVVQVTAVDNYGNTTTGNARVRVYAEAEICSEVPVGTEYIFIYPNPNTGSFKIATPADVTLQRVEVFDHRGRFITARNYESTVSEYAMELGPLQEAVYVLKLHTNDGVYVKRMIFKN